MWRRKVTRSYQGVRSSSDLTLPSSGSRVCRSLILLPLKAGTPPHTHQPPGQVTRPSQSLTPPPPAVVRHCHQKPPNVLVFGSPNEYKEWRRF